MRQFSRPISLSAAACKRIFSYLDRYERSCKKKKTLRLLLFLRGNHELSKLVSEANDARIINQGLQATKKAEIW